MFWSGADLKRKHLNVRGEKFKDASVFYNDVSEIEIKELKTMAEKIKRNSMGL